MKFKLIKGRSYTGSFKATRKAPVVELEKEEEIKEALSSGFFEEIKEKFVAPELVPAEGPKEAETAEAEEAKSEDEAEPAFESEAEEAKPQTSSKGKGKK